MKRNAFAQALTLIVAAAVIAIVANGFAANTRKLMLPGYYPNALKVPPPEPATPAPPPARTETAPEPTMTAPVTETTATIVPVVPAQTATVATAAPVVPTHTAAPAPAPVPAPTPAAQKPPTPAADALARFQPHPDKPYIEISGDDAQLLHAKGVLFLDARRTAVYEESHIAGARPYSVWEADIDDKVNKLFDERQDPTSQNLPIVIYCTGGACEDSHMLAQKLWGVQFNNVYVYKDGFPDWQKRGGAVRTGGAS